MLYDWSMDSYYSTLLSPLNFLATYFAKRNLNCGDFEKRSVRNPARIHSPDPFLRAGNQPKFWQILSPENSFAKTSSAVKPHALPEYLEGRTPKKNVLSIFKKKFTPAKSKKQETFFFGVAGVLASAWGFLRAYDLVSSHHARGACEVITSL